MGAFLTIALRQMRASPALTAVLALGMLVAAVLLASAPIYSRSMADLGLTYTIRQELQGNATSQVLFPNVELQTDRGIALREAIEQRITERIGWFRREQTRSVQMGKFWLAKPGEPQRPGQPLAEPQALQRYEDKVRVLSGRLPAPGDGKFLEVAMSVRAAQAANLRLDDSFVLHEEFDNCDRPLATDDSLPPPFPCEVVTSVTFTISGKLVGIIEPIDPEDSFWVGTSSRYFEPFRVRIPNSGPVVQMLADEATLMDGFGKLRPAYRGTVSWLIAAEPERLNRTNFERAREDLTQLYKEFEPFQAYAISPLRDAFLRFDRTADYQQTPLLVLLLEITGIALFYVGLVSAIVVERQAAEIGLLRGRGATVLQILTLYATQGLMLGIPILIAAPFIAGGITALLGLTPVFDQVTDTQVLPVTIVPLSFALAAGAVALSVVALLAPALAAALKGSTSVRRGLSRPLGSFVQRYYLDVGLAAVAFLLLWELRERGSVFTPSATGGVSTDPLLLASPALAIVGAGALLLRLYPLALRVIARFATIVAGAPLALGLWQTVRNSGQYTRLTLLLMMAVAVGTFAASYTSTADRSYRDRANYEAGVDLRAASGNNQPPATKERDDLAGYAAKLPGVTSSMDLVRTTATIATPGSSGGQFQVLAIVPGQASEMLWFRDDLADKSLKAVLGVIDGLPAAPGKAIPTGAQSLTIWGRMDEPITGMTLRAGLRDSKGRFAIVELAPLEDMTTEWAQFTAPLSRFPHGDPGQFTLVSLVFTGSTSRPTAPTVFFDDLAAQVPNGPAVVLEDFEGPSPWALFPTTSATGDSFTIVAQGAHAGTGAAKFQPRPGSIQETRGVYLAGFLTPLPIVVSQSFIDGTGVGVGGTAMLRVASGTLVPVTVRGTFDLFPTTHSRDGAVVVFNRDRFLDWTAIAFSGSGTELSRNEVWLSLDGSADPVALGEALTAAPFYLDSSVSRAEALAAATKNPLIAASGSGILAVAFVAILLLVAAALLISLLAAVRRRRVELAVVRAIGLTARQVLFMLVVEYSSVFLVGVAAGSALGLFVSSRMLSFLDVTETGERVEPSFIVETRWLTVAVGIVVVFALFAVALWLASRLAGRTASAEALRSE